MNTKHLIPFLLLVFVCFNANCLAKESTIKYGRYASYVGEVEKGKPMGSGQLLIEGGYKLVGSFDNGSVSDAVLTLPYDLFEDYYLVVRGSGRYTEYYEEQEGRFFVFNGQVTYSVKDRNSVIEMSLLDGALELFNGNNERIQTIGSVKEEPPFIITVNLSSTPAFRASGAIVPVVKIGGYLESITRWFADEGFRKAFPAFFDKEKSQYGSRHDYAELATYLLGQFNDAVNKSQIDCHPVEYQVEPKASLPVEGSSIDKEKLYEAMRSCYAYLTVRFANGTVVDCQQNEIIFKNTNGDYLHVDKFDVLDYELSSGNNKLSKKDGLVLLFNNGNKYKGQINEDYSKEEFSSSGSFLMKHYGADQFGINWSDFLKVATEGSLSYSDGSYYEGTFNNKGILKRDRLSPSHYKNGTLYNANGEKITSYVEGKDIVEIEKEKQRIEALRPKYEQLKQSDYINFTPDLSGFRKTFPDCTVVEASADGNWTIKVEYEDGTVMQSYPGWFRVNDDFYKKYILNADRIPSFYDVSLLGKTILTCGTWSFPDGFSLKVNGNPNEGGKYGIIISTPDSENGDFATVYFGHPSTDSEKESARLIETSFLRFRKTTDKGILIAQGPIAITESNFNNRYRGEVLLRDGTRYEGSYKIKCNNQPTQLEFDPRIEAAELLVSHSYENIVFDRFENGELYDSNDKIVAIYRSGKKLDDYDFAKALVAMEQRKQKKEEELQKKREEEERFESLCNEYGKEYVDAWLRGTIKIGMPFALIKDDPSLRKTSESQYNTWYDIHTFYHICVDKNTGKVTYFYYTPPM